MRSSVESSDPAVHLGPALETLTPDDGEGVRELFAEQRARLQVIRRNAIWHCLGDLDRHATRVTAVLLHGAAVVAIGSTLFVAGTDRGPVLWACGALSAALLASGFAARELPRRKRLRLFRRGVLRPAVLLERDAIDSQEIRVDVLIGLEVADAAALRRLVAAGDGSSGMLDGAVEPPAELRDFVDGLRRAREQRTGDGSRVGAPPAPGVGRVDFARIRVDRERLPDERLASRLLFVLVDEEDRGPGSACVPDAKVWGESAPSLCACYPLRSER
jgi:hypothetical protein